VHAHSDYILASATNTLAEAISCGWFVSWCAVRCLILRYAITESFIYIIVQRETKMCIITTENRRKDTKKTVAKSCENECCSILCVETYRDESESGLV
jgi:hypothetical protein